MKTKSLLLASVLCFTAPHLILGCSAEESEQADMGQLRMPLTSTSGSGANYRLTSAVFDIVGPTGGQLSSDDYVGEPVAVVDLSEGDYQLDLQPGWVLEREEGGGFVPVDAALRGASTRAFSVSEGQVSLVQYVFATAGDEVVFGDGQLELSVSVEEVPGQWTCELAYFDAVDGCDCACGVPDPDCELPGQQVYGCNPGQTCSPEGLCEGGSVCGDGIVEPGEECDDGNTTPLDGCDACQIEAGSWTCEPAYYDAADGCDCACGLPDPDCELPDQQLYNCADGQECSPEGLCVSPPVCGNGVVEPGEECDDGNATAGDGCDACQVEGISGWACEPAYYGTADGCDCACGIPDPDCEIPDQQLYNCADGQVCSPEGFCVP